MLLLGLSLAADLPADADPSLRAAWEQAEAFPQDYASQLALAAAAQQSAPELALEAWAQADALSGGGPEARSGHVLTLVQLGEVQAARELAAASVAASPERAWPWLLQAEALRNPVGLQALALAAVRAHPSAQQAYALEPDDPWAQCGLAWSRLRLGDRSGARELFAEAADAGATCGVEGLGVLPQRDLGAAGLWLGVLSYPPSTGAGAGNVLTLQGGLTLAGRWTLDGTLRQARLQVLPPPPLGPAPLPPDLETLVQRELWLRGGLDEGAYGGQALLGAMRSDDGDALLYGGRAWARYGATLELAALGARYTDGDTRQLGLSLGAPVLTPLDLSLGVQSTRFAAVDQAPATGLSMSLGGRARFDPWSLDARLGLGRELRPYRWDSSVLWNLDEPIVGSLTLRGAVELRGLTLHLGYEQLWLAQTDSLAADSPAAPVHALTAGVSTSGEIR